MAVDLGDIARHTLAAVDAGGALEPWSRRHPDMGFEEAYAVSRAMRDARTQRGETIVGRKIGFTNKATWEQLGIDAAVWAPVYDTTVRAIEASPVDICGFHEPRIEPEIVIGLDADVDADATIGEVERCTAWVAFGFEIVQSIYPDWRFATSDAIINQGMHGCLIVGEKRSIPTDQRTGLAEKLAALEVDLARNGEVCASGAGRAVLGGPVHAVCHLASIAGHETLKAGETITTGTLTPVLPIEPGETWEVRVRHDPVGLNGPAITLGSKS